MSAVRTLLGPALNTLRGALLALAAAALSPSAWADSYADVQKLTSSGQLDKALVMADAYLQDKPRDPQMRFMRGVVLTEMGRRSEAEEVFLQLTRDHPELPEPYNNLAVLLAAREQIDQARLLLEAALRNDPSYATAHENLGDVLARLAARSYERALSIEPGRSSNKAKIDQLQRMLR